MIVTIRTVLWYVMSLAGTLLILVAMFTDKWLEGTYSPTTLSGLAQGGLDSFANLAEKTANNIENAVSDGNLKNMLSNSVGLFLQCTQPSGKKFFEGECIPDIKEIQKMFNMEPGKGFDGEQYPYAWRGAVVCFGLGLAIMVITDLFALLTICCRRCICCSVFTVCGSLQSLATITFTLGLVAYPAGWGSKAINETYCGGSAGIFQLGTCQIGFAFWLAVAGTVCTMLASSLAIWAYQSTTSDRAETRKNEGEKYICLP